MPHVTNPDDIRFLHDVTEVLLETAHYWCERVVYSPDLGACEMLMVMGPDEYTPFSRNNAYTNRLAAFSLSLATFAWEKLERLDGAAAAELGEKLRLREKEFKRFAHIAGSLRLPYDEDRRLVLQSDDFFTYQPLDLDRWWRDRSKPLGACVSQERLYRSRVLKQADVVQLMALLPHEFDAEQMRVAYETYEPLTSHDSSLSRSMHAIVAAWLGKDDQALRFWNESVGLDLQLGQAAEGIHAACAGANWQVAILGFGGLRTRMQSENLHLDPHLPATWSALRFPLVWNNQPFRVTIECARVTIEHRGQTPLHANIFGQEVTLEPGKTQTFVPAGQS